MQLKLSCSSLHQTKRESSNQKNPPPKVMQESEAQLGLIHFDLFAFHPNATQCHGLSSSTFFAALTIWCRARAHWLSSCPPNKCPEPCSSPLSLCKIWNMPIAEQTASSQVLENGLWLQRHALWLGRWNLEIASLLHTAGSSLLPRCSCTASPLCSRLYFLCWRSKTLNFFFISICKTKGGLLISNHSPCYDDLSDSVITSPLRLALTTWLDT